MLERAGFTDARLLRRTGFKSSPETIGAEFACHRPS